MMRAVRERQQPEPTIALINIVFLMLIFFMVAGTLAAPLDRDLRLVDTRTLDRRETPDALVLNAAGEVLYRGIPISDVRTYLETRADDAVAQIVPDRAAPARALLKLARRLEAAGAQKVVIVTEQALR